jgi:hypothetical protein
VQSNFASIGFSTQNSGSTQDCTELSVAGGDKLFLSALEFANNWPATT